MNDSTRKVKVTIDGIEYLVEVGDLSSAPITVSVNGHRYQVNVEDYLENEPPPLPEPISETNKRDSSTLAVAGYGSSVQAPMPGDITEICVEGGAQVSPGQDLCILEAMKMKNKIRSPHEGRIAEVHVQLGQTVEYGTTLFTFEGE